MNMAESQKLKQSFATYKSVCLDVKEFYKKNNKVYLQQKFKKLPDPAKMMKKYNMFKAEIASFEQECKNEFNLDDHKINSKYVLVNDKITSTVNLLRNFFTSHGIELTNSEISPPKILS